MNRVVITGLSAVTPLGGNLNKTWSRLLQGVIAVKPAQALGPEKDWNYFKSKLAAPIHEEFKYDDHSVPGYEDSRLLQVNNALIKEALEHAQIDKKNLPFNPRRAGIVLCNYTENSNQTFIQNPNDKTVEGVSQRFTFTAPTVLAKEYGFKGYSTVKGQACAAGAFAIGDAFHLIKWGYADCILTGGADFACNVAGYYMMDFSGALSHRNTAPQTAVRPFDHLRKGTVLGDGGGMMVMETLESAKRRGAPIICEVMGYSAFCHSLHPTSPDITGWDTFTVVKDSLLEAGMTPSEIDYVNAHAASNPMGDLPEAIGIQRLFGYEKVNKSLEDLKTLKFEDVKETDVNFNLSSKPLVTALKGNLGHPLLSAGSQEVILTVKSMIEGIVTPTPHLEIPCVDGLSYVKGEIQKREINAAIKSAFGFGGFASSIVFRKLRD